MIASFTLKQLSYQSLFFDMLYCARCGTDWDHKDGNLLIEADRLLRPGGYFVWTLPLTNARNKENQQQKSWFSPFVSIEKWEEWPSQANLNKNELAIHGLLSDEFVEDSDSWKSVIQNYWSLLSPLIFSDHLKRPGDEDPSPSYNMFRNI
ncbi:unnamed protein product [Vicia faba]|uniref:Methyltransferase n=1 Tax=Vicia faba TaxID=3906 RepID=A0AAV1BC63_VICFA|nr:unnamed protein product [Vicia faba]